MDHLKLFRSFLLTLTIVAVSPGLPSGRAIDVGVAGRSNAYPSIAAIDQFVAITWGAAAKGGATGVYSAISRDGGRTFAAPIAVSRADSPASLSGEQPPRVSLVPRRGHEPAVVVVWTSKTPEAPGCCRRARTMADDRSAVRRWCQGATAPATAAGRPLQPIRPGACWLSGSTTVRSRSRR